MCDDANVVPEPTEAFLAWLESLDEELVKCVASTIELANSMRDMEFHKIN